MPVTVQTTDDTLHESDEQFTVNLTTSPSVPAFAKLQSPSSSRPKLLEESVEFILLGRPRLAGFEIGVAWFVHRPSILKAPYLDLS